MDVGLELRQAREQRGLTLQQLAGTTKISPRVLQAIEASDQKRLPAPIYTRAFVKTYAQEVGLDPHDTLRRYLAQFQPPEDDNIHMPVPAPVPAVARPHAIHIAAELVHGQLAGPIAIGMVVVILAAIGITQRARTSGRMSAPQPRVMVAGLAPAAAPEETPVGTTGTSPADALHFAIAPTGPCWMQATVDQNPLFAKLLNAGERRTIDTSSEVTLRIGDPAVCAFTINGKPARISSAPGQAVTIHVTTENYRQFLAR